MNTEPKTRFGGYTHQPATTTTVGDHRLMLFVLRNNPKWLLLARGMVQSTAFSRLLIEHYPLRVRYIQDAENPNFHCFGRELGKRLEQNKYEDVATETRSSFDEYLVFTNQLQRGDHRYMWFCI